MTPAERKNRKEECIWRRDQLELEAGGGNERIVEDYNFLLSEIDRLREEIQSAIYNFESETTCQCCLNNLSIRDELSKALGEE